MPFAVLQQYFKLRPDYLPLWHRISAGAADLTTHETAQLLLVESDAYAAMGSNGTALHLCRQARYEFVYERERDLAFPMLARFARGSHAEAQQAAEQALAQLAKVPPVPIPGRKTPCWRA